MKVKYKEVSEYVYDQPIEKEICGHFGKGHNESLVVSVNILSDSSEVYYKVYKNRQCVLTTFDLKEAVEKYNSFQ